MNNRIKELAEQAGFMLWQDEAWNPGDVVDWSARYDKELEKFAELIVRECIDICYNHYSIEGITQNIEKDIREKFGVE